MNKLDCFIFIIGIKSIKIGHKENIGNENSILNGAIIIINDKDSVEKLVAVLKDKFEK